MKLELIKEAPKCLKCKVPMLVYKKNWKCSEDCCKYVYHENAYQLIMGHKTYQCNKCYNIYREK